MLRSQVLTAPLSGSWVGRNVLRPPLRVRAPRAPRAVPCATLNAKRFLDLLEGETHSLWDAYRAVMGRL